MLAVAVGFGSLVWMVMSFIVIPAVTRHEPTVGTRWLVLLAGHWVFVAVPILAGTAPLWRPRASWRLR